MTRKDYILFAARIARIPNRYIADIVADVVADVLAKDNPRFDRARFVDACGPLPFLSLSEAVGVTLASPDVQALALDNGADRARLAELLAPLVEDAR